MKLLKSIISLYYSIGNQMRNSDIEQYMKAKKPVSHADVERLLREYQEKQMMRNFI